MAGSGDGSDEEAPFITDKGCQEKNSRKPYGRIQAFFAGSVLPWILTSLLSLALVISSIQHQKSPKPHLWSSTDFPPAHSAITPIKGKFSSSLDFADPEHIYRIYDIDAPVYVGNRTEEIDRNWDYLIFPADIYISDDEARFVEGDLTKNTEQGGFKIELEVFHSLHCLNMIRKRIYSSQYPEMQTHNAEIHIGIYPRLVAPRLPLTMADGGFQDHCIESLRELIMCGGDMTPLPIEWSEKGHRINPNYRTTHECRDFRELKRWMKDRAA